MRDFILILFLLSSRALFSQTFTDSNLPIIIINTDGGVTIPDNPRVLATMKIINRGNDQRNYVSDQDNNSYLNYNGRIDIEIRGSSSQALPKKQYGFTTLENDNESDNDVSLLGLPKESDWIINGLAFDPALIRDYLCYNLSRQIGQYASRTVYCEVVINGSYNGLYVLQEKIKQDQNRVNVIKIGSADISFPAVTGGYITKADKPDSDPVAWRMSSYIGTNDVTFIHELPKPENVKPQQNDYIKGEFMKLSNEAFLNNNSPVDGVPSVIDIPSFIDYMLLNEFSANTDAYQFSTFFHKDRGGKLRAGPVWDMNLTFGNDLFMWGYDRSKTNTWQFSNNDNEGPLFWRNLFNNPEFKCLLTRRWNELISPGNPFNRDVIEKFIDNTILNIREAAGREQARWETVGNLDNQVGKLKNFIRQRTEWISTQLGATTDCNLPSPPSLVIQKIMYNPMTPASNPEFICIANAGNTIADLTGVYFGGTGFVYQFPPYSVLLPGSRVILTNDINSFTSTYGFVPFAQFTRALPDKGTDLLLLDCYGNVIDRVIYSSVSPWPGASGNGKYLELTDLNSDNNDPRNWIASGNMIVSSEITYSEPSFSVYPNPVTDVIHITCADIIDRIRLIDVQGNIFYDGSPGSRESIIHPSIRPGMYFMKIYSGRRQINVKVIKL